ncbi:MAG: Ger(x)C family spore germination protein [Lysinibacillus sp.]
MKKCCLLLLTALILAGCWDASVPERMYYAHGIGVDYVDDQFEVYVQVIDFANVAKSEQRQPDVPQAEIGRGRGKTMDDAVLDVYHTLDMRLYWGHLSFVVFSKAALEEGQVKTVVNSLTSYRETRYQIWIYGTEEKISDVMLATPVLNTAINLSSLADPLNAFHQESYIPPVDFRQYILRVNEPDYTVSLPMVKLKKNWKSEEEEKKRIDYDGLAVISKKELKGVLLGQEIAGTQFMTDKTERALLTYSLKDKPVSIIAKNIKVDVKSKPVGDSFQFDIKVKLNASLSEFHTVITEGELTKSVKKEVERKIRETYHTALEEGIDIYRLSNYAYRQHVKEWKNVEEDGRVPLDEDSISSVEVYIDKLSTARKEIIKETTESD